MGGRSLEVGCDHTVGDNLMIENGSDSVTFGIRYRGSYNYVELVSSHKIREVRDFLSDVLDEMYEEEAERLDV